MAKGIMNPTKFIRAVLTQEIQNTENKPYTVGTAAELIAFLQTTCEENLEEEWVERYGIDVPDGWRTAQGKFGEKVPSGELSQAHKKAVTYGRKFINRDLDRQECPFKRVVKPDADSGDEDELVMKTPSEL